MSDVEDPPVISLYEAVFCHYALLVNTSLAWNHLAGDAGKEEGRAVSGRRTARAGQSSAPCSLR